MSGSLLVDFITHTVGFVFHQYNLLPALTPAENAAVPLVIAGWPWGRAVTGRRSVAVRSHFLPPRQPPAPLPGNPCSRAVAAVAAVASVAAAVGTVEARSGNIAVGRALPGVVLRTLLRPIPSQRHPGPT